MRNTAPLEPPAAIRLITPDLAAVDAALVGPAALGRVLGCDVADGWNGFPAALRRIRDRIASDPSGAVWWARLFLVPSPPTLVGWGGFKGPPREGVVELGYEIAPSWRGRGLAGAAVSELLLQAWAEPAVRAVIAHTLRVRNPSVRVLEKAGFRREGVVEDDQVGAAWRHRLERAELSVAPELGGAQCRESA